MKDHGLVLEACTDLVRWMLDKWWLSWPVVAALLGRWCPWLESKESLAWEASAGRCLQPQACPCSCLQRVRSGHSVVSDSVWPHGLGPPRLLHPWDSPGKNTGVACHFLLQGIFLTQESNLGLLHCRQPLYCLSPQGSPWFGEGRPLLNAWAVPHSFSPSELHSDIPLSSFQTTQHSGASPCSFLGLGRKDIDHGRSLAGLSCARVVSAALAVENLPASAAAPGGGRSPRVGKIPRRRKWQPAPVLVPGDSHGQRSLAGCSPWGPKGSDMTEATWHAHMLAGSVTLLPFLPDVSRCIQWEAVKRYISVKQSSIPMPFWTKEKCSIAVFFLRHLVRYKEPLQNGLNYLEFPYLPNQSLLLNTFPES